MGGTFPKVLKKRAALLQKSIEKGWTFPKVLKTLPSFNTLHNIPMTILRKWNKIINFAQATSPGGGMVDALVSGASAARRAGSSPVLGTTKER